MLAKLTIKNVALIENAEIQFQEGLNVLSGETGAGKSVILDSVNFVLGAKADRSMIRYGETECFVKAEFLLPENSKAVEILRNIDIDSDGEIIISRRFSETGKNAIKINGNTVSVAMLRQVTDTLVDVHGQSEHFYLLKESNQLKLLDSVIGQPVRELKENLKALLQEKNAIESEIDLLGGDETERNRRLELLAYQIEEIQAVDLKENEEEDLLLQRNKIMHLEKIILALKDADQIFSSEMGVLDGLRGVLRSLHSIAKFDEVYSLLSERIEALTVEAEDVLDCIVSAGDALYFDEGEAEAIETRLDGIRALKRKYGADKAAIDAYLESIIHEHDLLSDCEGKYTILTEQKAKILVDIYKVCKKITELRQSFAKTFCDQVTNELVTLNIPKAQFTVDFNTYGKEDAVRATGNGLDEITFLFSANAGEPMKPLGKIISGGEMSRFMLAIKTRLSGINGISTYIFDEIDAGISGKTAKTVGEKLALIAKSTQIIAVSHLAQIAVMSDSEYLIEKREVAGKTITNVFPLDENRKIDEIVRLLGGGENDQFARKHAEELLQKAVEYKTNLS